MRCLRVALTAFWTLAAFLSSGTSVLGIDGTPTWSLSQVSEAVADYEVSTPVLAFDHYGTASVSWSSVSQMAQSNTAYHSQFLELGLWTHREVASGNDVGLRTALSFDRAERPTIAWLNGSGAISADFNGGAPQEFVTGANTTNPVLSLSHDLAGNLRGMFGGATPGEFFSIDYSGGVFSSEQLATIGGLDAVADAALTTDYRGLRQIVARAELTVGEAVVIASEPPGGGDWPSAQFATADAVGGVDIAVDPTDGRMALAYTTSEGETSELHYSKFNGISWETTSLASSPATSYVFEDVSLAFDRDDGLPAIAYERRGFTPSEEELLFAYLDASEEWQTGLAVDGSISMNSSDGKPRGPSLAFDDYGTSWPAISYVDDDGSLMVAFDPPVPEPGVMGLLCAGIGALVGRRRYVCRFSQFPV